MCYVFVATRMGPPVEYSTCVPVCYVFVATRMGPPVEYSICVLCLCSYKDGASICVLCL